MKLEDKATGKSLDFNLYEEKSVPFLKPEHEENSIILKNLIDGDIDDDC